jgi:hypothetical protein
MSKTVDEVWPRRIPDETTTLCEHCGLGGLIQVGIQTDREWLSYFTCLDCSRSSWTVNGKRSSGDDALGTIRDVWDTTRRRGGKPIVVRGVPIPEITGAPKIRGTKRIAGRMADKYGSIAVTRPGQPLRPPV